nr:helix-turn-helix transcriptional regulator [uncultured Gellertiella sp.]
MSVDLDALFKALTPLIGRSGDTDREIGEHFRQMVGALVRFDHLVVFAYRDAAPPVELYSTFNAEERIIYVTLYQEGPYLLDPFYHTARQGRAGVFRMRELAPDRFFSSEYYRSYYMQTGLAEEIGFFVPLGDGTTVVLSLMRRERAGPFPASEFSVLRKAEPLVASIVRHGWTDLAARFVAERQRRGRRGRKGRHPGDGAASDAGTWRDLKLTSRETAIIDLVLQGHSSESIGLKLNISTGTVKVHRRNVYRKLGISSQTQLLSIYLKTLI